MIQTLPDIDDGVYLHDFDGLENRDQLYVN